MIGLIRSCAECARNKSFSSKRPASIAQCCRRWARNPKTTERSSPITSRISNSPFVDSMEMRSPQPGRSGLKKARISAARSSGCSAAAKWPPRDISVQCCTL
jgi:hypothetical protein